MPESQSEILRKIESQSIQYLKYFFLLWGTIIAFIFQYQTQNPLAETIFNNLGDLLISDIGNFDAVLNWLFIYTLLAFAIIVLGRLMITGINEVYSSKQELKRLIDQKYDSLKACTQLGIINSLILIGYLAYLIGISDLSFKNTILSLKPLIIIPCLAVFYILSPLANLINYWKTSRIKATGWALILIYGISCFGVYPLNHTITILNKIIAYNELFGVTILMIWMCLFWLISLLIFNSFRKEIIIKPSSFAKHYKKSSPMARQKKLNGKS